jgi:hypothetical protein
MILEGMTAATEYIAQGGDATEAKLMREKRAAIKVAAAAARRPDPHFVNGRHQARSHCLDDH